MGRGLSLKPFVFSPVTNLSGGLGVEPLTSEPRCLQVLTLPPEQSHVFNTTESEKFGAKTQTLYSRSKSLPLGAAHGERFCWSTSALWIQPDLLPVSQNKADISFLHMKRWIFSGYENPFVGLSCSPGKDWLSPPGMCQPVSKARQEPVPCCPVPVP